MSMRVLALALTLTLSLAAPAHAQMTARDAIVRGMNERGISSSQYQLQPRDWSARYWDDASGGYATYDGLRLSSALAMGGGQFTYVVIVTNVSSQRICVRGKVLFEPTSAVNGRNTLNNSIEPGGYTTLLSAVGTSSNLNYREFASVAFWKPAPNMAQGYCTAAAPPGLDAWLNDGQTSTFRNSNF